METETLKTDFVIKTDGYEGPFELVLELIEKRKLLVNDLSLSEITDDFISQVRAKQTFPVEETANFIQIAATLLLIKSKSLIPDLALSEDEKEDVEDLKRRLSAYEKIREVSRLLGQAFGTAPLFPAGERKPEIFFSPSADLSIAAIDRAFAELLQREKDTEAELPKTKVKTVISLEEMMQKLAKRVESAMTLFFKDFAGGLKERSEIIVSFLALLELVKQDSVSVEQYAPYGDIRITHTASHAVPRYE